MYRPSPAFEIFVYVLISLTLAQCIVRKTWQADEGHFKDIPSMSEQLVKNNVVEEE